MAKRSQRIVVVEWLDATSGDAEIGPADLVDGGVLTRTVGWLIKRDHRGIYLSTDVTDRGDRRCLNFVPRGMVRSVAELG